jgi:hypothetical protein
VRFGISKQTDPVITNFVQRSHPRNPWCWDMSDLFPD